MAEIGTAEFFDPYTWESEAHGTSFTWTGHGYTINSQFIASQNVLSIFVQPHEGEPEAVDVKMNLFDEEKPDESRDPTHQDIRRETFDMFERLYRDGSSDLPN